MNDCSKFLKIMDKEARLNYKRLPKWSNKLNNPLVIKGVATRVLEIAKNSAVIRVGVKTGHLTKDNTAYESDGAHTNLVRALVDYALDFIYGWNNSPPFYDRREMGEAVLRHDLPENETGDTADNNSHDEAEKRKHDKEYQKAFSTHYPDEQFLHTYRIETLLDEMETKISEEGRILYSADKVAAIIAMLAYESIGKRPYVGINDDSMSELNKTELKLCEIDENNEVLLSELFTADYLEGRDLIRYDDSGFFTAILIMTTIIVHEKWYDWREKKY